MVEKTGKVNKVHPIPQHPAIYHQPPLEVAQPWRSYTLVALPFLIFGGDVCILLEEEGNGGPYTQWCLRC